MTIHWNEHAWRMAAARLLVLLNATLWFWVVSTMAPSIPFVQLEIVAQVHAPPQKRDKKRLEAAELQASLAGGQVQPVE